MENHNGCTSYINPSGSHSVTPTKPLFWEDWMNFGGPIRKNSNSYYSDSENSNPRSLPSPEELTRPFSNSPSPHGFVEKPLSLAMKFKFDQGASTSSNVPCQQFPSQRSPSPDLKSSPTVRIAKLKEKCQKKKMKKEMNKMEFLRQNMPASGSSKQVYQHRELNQSPVPSTSSMENYHQEQSIPTNVCQNDVNLTSPNNVGTPTPTKSSVVYMKKRNSRRKKPAKFTYTILTQEVYETAPGFKIPRYSKGIISRVTCKFCKYSFDTKHELWIHFRKHVPPNKLYECPEPYCAFVTDLNHHLTYHKCLHQGLREFLCSKCNYTATNKAMLRSHEKQHIDFYFYICKDCHYGNKYVNNFKIHLQARGHKVGKVFDIEGNEIDKEIDVYGKKRGPKTNKKNKKDKTSMGANRKQKPTVKTPPISSECLNDNLLQENLNEAQNLGRQDAQLGSISPTIENHNANPMYLQSILPSMSNSSGSQMEPTNYSSIVNTPLNFGLLLAMTMMSTSTIRPTVANPMEISSDEVEETQALNLSMKDSNNESSNTGRSSGASKRKGTTIIKYVSKQE
ncbi:protein hunchback [Cotesia glomerata]|nr:protein hunchback [Cotesia glomerata]